jgi:hypothetical protein
MSDGGNNAFTVRGVLPEERTWRSRFSKAHAGNYELFKSIMDTAFAKALARGGAAVINPGEYRSFVLKFPHVAGWYTRKEMTDYVREPDRNNTDTPGSETVLLDFNYLDAKQLVDFWPSSPWVAIPPCASDNVTGDLVAVWKTSRVRLPRFYYHFALEAGPKLVNTLFPGVVEEQSLARKIVKLQACTYDRGFNFNDGAITSMYNRIAEVAKSQRRRLRARSTSSRSPYDEVAAWSFHRDSSGYDALIKTSAITIDVDDPELVASALRKPQTSCVQRAIRALVNGAKFGAPVGGFERACMHHNVALDTHVMTYARVDPFYFYSDDGEGPTAGNKQAHVVAACAFVRVAQCLDVLNTCIRKVVRPMSMPEFTPMTPVGVPERVPDIPADKPPPSVPTLAEVQWLTTVLEPTSAAELSEKTYEDALPNNAAVDRGVLDCLRQQACPDPPAVALPSVTVNQETVPLPEGGGGEAEDVPADMVDRIWSAVAESVLLGLSPDEDPERTVTQKDETTYTLNWLNNPSNCSTRKADLGCLAKALDLYAKQGTNGIYWIPDTYFNPESEKPDQGTDAKAYADWVKSRLTPISREKIEQSYVDNYGMTPDQATATLDAYLLMVADARRFPGPGNVLYSET